jgi:hypothetical protein
MRFVNVNLAGQGCKGMVDEKPGIHGWAAGPVGHCENTEMR